MRTKVCPRCPERGPQPWEAFHAKEKLADGSMRWPSAYCRECHREYVRLWHLRKRETDPEWVAARNRRKLESLKADPERYATARARKRDWQRRTRGTPSERQREASGPGRYVDSAPIRAAIKESGVSFHEIAQRLGLFDESSVWKSVGRARMQVGTAVRILAALGLDPVDVGL